MPAGTEIRLGRIRPRQRRILTIEKIVFVSLDDDGVPTPHGYSEITYNRDRMPTERIATGTIRLP